MSANGGISIFSDEEMARVLNPIARAWAKAPELLNESGAYCSPLADTVSLICVSRALAASACGVPGRACITHSRQRAACFGRFLSIRASAMSKYISPSWSVRLSQAAPSTWIAADLRFQLLLPPLPARSA